MGKMLTALLVIIAINIVLSLYTGVTIPGSALWTFIQSPFDWSSTNLIDFLKDTIAVVGVSAIIVGTVWVKSDFIIFAGIAAVFLSFGQSLYHFWNFIRAQDYWGGQGDWIALIFVSPLIIAYLVVIFDFWRGKD